MSAGSGQSPLRVVILGDWLPFPNGMAVTSRARLMARAMHLAGADVRVLTLQAADRPPRVENTAKRGDYHGVSYEYTCGTTVRDERFLIRRVIEIWGWLHGALRLSQLRREGRLDVVLLWFWTPRPTLHYFFFVTLLRLLGVPIVRELNEPPWSHWEGGSTLGRRLPALIGMSGAVAISDELHRWSAGQTRERPFTIIDVPILVDVDERPPAPYPDGEQLLVFSGMIGDDKPLRLILAAMSDVWQVHPDCRLIITASDRDVRGADWLHTEILKPQYASRVQLSGYVSRDALFDFHARASALLIPLLDDQRSRSRFPTKIGEYLASARPIVTSAVGEVSRYFDDGVNAVVCPPGDAKAYAAAIVRLLSDPQHAAAIGQRGRDVAESAFDYRGHGAVLVRALSELVERAAEG